MSEVHEVPKAPPTSTPVEWVLPLLFILVFGWVVWNGANYLIALPGDEATRAALVRRYGTVGALDWAMLLLAPLIFAAGVLTVRRAPMEYQDWGLFDRVSVFIGRVTMMSIAILVCVMIYEVVLRYAFERPTIWANELSLWFAGFIFLLAGLYAMQQRAHIRIYLLYDLMPRWAQRVCDTISTLLIVFFAFMLFWGGYGEAAAKFARWETFGTAFDPPLPATLKPLVLVVVALVAVQAIANLVRDWNAEPVIHSAADDVDMDEVERLRRQVGTE